MNRNRWIAVVSVSLVVLFIVVYGFMPKAVAVDMAAVRRGPLRVTVDEEGKTRVRDRFVISAPVAGFLRRVELKVGDAVAAGQKVAELEPLRSVVLDPRSRAEAVAGTAAADANLSLARENARAAAADEEYAQAKLTRMKQLVDEGFATRDAYDLARSGADKARASRLAAEAAVKAAGHELERARSAINYSAARHQGNYGEVVAIRSAVKGRVLKVQRESESAVNAGEPVIDIGNPEKLEVKVEVLSADAVRIKPGMPVVFERWGGEQHLSGVVRVVEPAAFTKVSSLGVEEQRVLVIADITTVPDAWQRMGDGYRVEASFILWEGKDILQVPASALFRSGDGWAVFAVSGGRARKRPVTVGNRNGLAAEILSGIAEKEQVITHPDDTVSDGVRVKERGKN